VICEVIKHSFQVIKKHPCWVFYPDYRYAASALTLL